MKQNTIQFKVGNPLQGMTDLEKSIALPHEYKAQRYPNFPALERTSLMQFNVPTNTAIPQDYPYMRGMLTRQAGFPLWVDQTVSAGYQMGYWGTMSQEAGTGAASKTMVDQGTSNFTVNPQGGFTNVDYSGATNTTYLFDITGYQAPAWQYPIVGRDSALGSRDYMYFPANTYREWFVTTNADKASIVTNNQAVYISVSYEVWNESGEVSFVETVPVQWGITATTLPNTVSVANFTTSNTTGIWMRPTMVIVKSVDWAMTAQAAWFGEFVVAGFWSTAAYTVTIGTVGKPAIAKNATGVQSKVVFTPVSAPPEFAVTTLPYSNTRVTASAVLFTNVTKILNKEGSVLAGRLPMSMNTFNFSSTSLAGLHPAEKALLPLETGFYTYAPPTTDMSTFLDYTRSDEKGTKAPLFRLDNTGMVNCFILQDPDVTNVSSFAVNLDWHLEFRSTSTLFEIGVSQITLEAFHQATINLLKHGFFFSNDTHKSLIHRIVSAGRALMPMFNLIAPGPASMLTNGALTAADAVLNRSMQTTPKTTTAEGVGLATKPAPPKTKAKTAAGKKQQRQQKVQELLRLMEK